MTLDNKDIQKLVDAQNLLRVAVGTTKGIVPLTNIIAALKIIDSIIRE